MALGIEKLRDVIEAWIEDDLGLDMSKTVIGEDEIDQLADRLQAAMEERDDDYDAFYDYDDEEDD